MTIFAPLLVAALLNAPVPAIDSHQIEGIWTITSIQKGDRQMEKSVKVTFREGRYALPAADGFTDSTTGEYAIEADETPHEITLNPDDGPNKGKPIMGIYRVRGDTMQACYDPSGAGRPMRFEAKPGTGYVLVTYQKASTGRD